MFHLIMLDQVLDNNMVHLILLDQVLENNMFHLILLDQVLGNSVFYHPAISGVWKCVSLFVIVL